MWVFLFYRNENPMPKNEECSMEKESIMKDEALEIEALQQEARELMQEMLLKHQELDPESFQNWWEEEGREKQYFSLQGRIEELEEAAWRKKFLSYTFEEEVSDEV